MTTADDLQRENNLLKSSLRELFRIFKEAETDACSADPETALDGELLKRWRIAKRKAQQLVGTP